jgi:hypothetical protein
MTDTSALPTGTGQEGAGAPSGATKEIPVHLEGGKHIDKMDQIANRAALKGKDRQHREDPTEFTK